MRRPPRAAGRAARPASRSERLAPVDARALTQAWAPRALPAAAPASAGPVEPLTAREREVLARLGQRWSNKEIAAALHVTPETVKSHVAHLTAKLGAAGRRAAAQRAAELGLLPAG